MGYKEHSSICLKWVICWKIYEGELWKTVTWFF